jgi:hypothetical protein
MNVQPNLKQFGSLVEIGDDVLINHYLDLRAKHEQLSEDFKKATKPINNSMQAIEAVMYQRLVERGSKHSAVEGGTAARVRNLAVKCLDKLAYLRFCFGNPDEAANLLTANVAKDGLASFLERHDDEPPPGISVQYVETVRITRR